MRSAKRPIKASAGLDPQTNEVSETVMLLSDENVSDIANCLGVASIPPGDPPTTEIAHSTSEVMFVAAGTGQLITPGATVAFSKGDAIFIPADLPHALQNNGSETLVSVFSFPSPNRPADSQSH